MSDPTDTETPEQIIDKLRAENRRLQEELAQPDRSYPTDDQRKLARTVRKIVEDVTEPGYFRPECHNDIIARTLAHAGVADINALNDELEILREFAANSHVCENYEPDTGACCDNNVSDIDDMCMPCRYRAIRTINETPTEPTA